MSTPTNTEYAASLRELADFYDAHAEMPVPHPSVFVFMDNTEEFLAGVRELAHGGIVQKRADPKEGVYALFHASRQFGCLKLDMQISRARVCKLVTPAVYDCPPSLLEEGKEFTEVTS